MNQVYFKRRSQKAQNDPQAHVSRRECNQLERLETEWYDKELYNIKTMNASNQEHLYF
jgi:serine/threonine-protein kinase RIO1